MDSKTINLLAEVTNGVEPGEDDPHSVYEQIALDLFKAGQLADLTREVQDYYRALRTSRHYGQLVQERLHFVFLRPLPKGAKPTVVSENPSLKIVDMPQRQPVKVRLLDLDAFCAAEKLDRDAMYRVGMGEDKEHKGWTRRPGMGATYLLGKDWIEPTPVKPPMPADGHQEVRVRFQYAPVAVEWTPPED
ncbi:MAG TPA: hypothetical protein VH591_08865 [Ktedonobacterales bacterium]|jgi:hypothetical protein